MCIKQMLIRKSDVMKLRRFMFLYNTSIGCNELDMQDEIFIIIIIRRQMFE